MTYKNVVSALWKNNKTFASHQVILTYCILSCTLCVLYTKDVCVLYTKDVCVLYTKDVCVLYTKDARVLYIKDVC